MFTILVLFTLWCWSDLWSYQAEKERHKELMTTLKAKKPRKRVTRRRLAKDYQGNLLAEEVLIESEEDAEGVVV